MKRKDSVRWLVLWMAAAATASIGVLLLYLGPNIYLIGKGFVPGPLLGQAPLALVAIGSLGMIVGAGGIVKTLWRLAVPAADDQGTLQRTSAVRTTGPADAAAYTGFIVGTLALAAVILALFVWPAIARNAAVGPCYKSPTVACFSAHPDFYRELPPGSGHYSTPTSRFSDDVLRPAALAAWPLAFAAALISVFALVLKTARRRVAVVGLILGSMTVIGLATDYLALLLSGGGE